MGSLDFFIAAPLFLLLGVSSWAFRLAYLPFRLVFLLFSYRWTRELTDSRGALFALLYALFPSATVMICIGRGGYTVLLVLEAWIPAFAGMTSRKKSAGSSYPGQRRGPEVIFRMPYRVAPVMRPLMKNIW